MALVDTWVGRTHPQTQYPVQMFLYREFNNKTLQDTWMLVLKAGYQQETITNLTPSEAMRKWEANKKWWS